ncbi:MAG: histidine kinase, partial [Firmicutes bacterium]|nr:histidine kinase [Bacillota bacterium]
MKEKRAGIFFILPTGDVMLQLIHPAILWASSAWIHILAAISGLLGLFFLLRSPRYVPQEMPSSLSDTEATVKIGHQVLPHLRQGLNRETAQHIADIIQHTVGVEAVAITDTTTVLGWSGKRCPQHGPGSSLSSMTRFVMSNHTPQILDTAALQGAYDDCRLGVVVISPLISQGQSVGSIKLYVSEKRLLPHTIIPMANGIAQLLSILLEVAEVDRQKSLAAAARLEALQAQIRPHFLFNVLNTIILFSRTDADRARSLLIDLAAFFRHSLARSGPTLRLQDELEYVKIYLNLEKARYGEKLQYEFRIDPDVLTRSVPALILQPLVENAVVHGISEKEGPGLIRIRLQDHHGDTLIYISDNGSGIP